MTETSQKTFITKLESFTKNFNQVCKSADKGSKACATCPYIVIEFDGGPTTTCTILRGLYSRLSTAEKLNNRITSEDSNAPFKLTDETIEDLKAIHKYLQGYCRNRGCRSCLAAAIKSKFRETVFENGPTPDCFAILAFLIDAYGTLDVAYNELVPWVSHNNYRPTP